jgi:hypothetical protein
MESLASVSSLPLASQTLEITKFLFEEWPHPNENGIQFKKMKIGNRSSKCKSIPSFIYPTMSSWNSFSTFHINLLHHL